MTFDYQKALEEYRKQNRAEAMRGEVRCAADLGDPCFCTGACRGDKPNKKAWFIDHNTKYEG